MAFYVYIMTNKPNGTLYVGITNNLQRRIYEHKNGIVEGFTKKYILKKLVYIEIYDEVSLAIQREKTIKHYVRSWKINLIELNNPDWKDLSSSLLFQILETSPRMTKNRMDTQFNSEFDILPS